MSFNLVLTQLYEPSLQIPIMVPSFFIDFAKTRKVCTCKTSQRLCILCGLRTCDACAEDPLDDDVVVMTALLAK